MTVGIGISLIKGPRAMETKAFEDLKKLLTPIFIRTGAIKAVLFGSLAAGKETRRSDLDLMIVKETDKRFFDRFDEFSEILDLVPDRDIDLLIYTPEELESISHRSFIRKILAEGRLLYEH
jgi:predicted nucleotidyltransferase